VAHHGSDTATSEPWLRAVAPAVAVVSVGRDNPFGHPSPRVMALLRRLLPPGQVLTTARHGDITLSTDGRRLWLAMERP